MTVALDGTAGKALISNASSGSVALTTTTSKINDILLIFIVTAHHATSAASPPIVSSIATTGLTWAQRKAITNTGGCQFDAEIWWAATGSSTGTFSTTVNLSAAGDAVLLFYAVSGAASQTSPFDSNSSLPASATGTSTAPSVKLSTSNINDMIIGFVAQGALVAATSLTSTPVSGEAGTVGNIISDVTANGTSMGSQLDNIEGDTEFTVVSSTQTTVPVSFTLGNSEPWTIIADAIQSAPTTVLYAPSQLPINWADSTGVLIGDNFYIAGGYQTSGTANLQAYVYNILSDTYTALPNIPSSLGTAGAVGVNVNGTPYFIGAGGVANLLAFDIATNSWVTKMAPPTIIANGPMAWFDGSKIHLIGDSDVSPFPPIHYIYDPVADTWDSTSGAAPLPASNSFGTIGVRSDGKIIYINGNYAPTQHPYIYDPSLNTWTARTSSWPAYPPIPADSSQVYGIVRENAVYHDYLLIVSGQLNAVAGTFVTDILIYNMNTDTFTFGPTFTGVARDGHWGFIYGDTYFQFGGRNTTATPIPGTKYVDRIVLKIQPDGSLLITQLSTVYIQPVEELKQQGTMGVLLAPEFLPI